MNNKPNYNRGTTRYTLVNLLHVSIVLTSRARSLLPIPPSTLANTVSGLRKEGVLEKGHNEVAFDCLSTKEYAKHLTEYENKLPKPSVDFYSHYGARDLKRAKYAKGKNAGESRRVIQSSEVVTIMYTAGIPTLPDDKKDIVKNKTITNNVYYQSREIKAYAGYAADVEHKGKENVTVATRVNGTLLSAGGNYNVYHLGRDIRAWSAQGEYKIKNLIQNMLAGYINKDSCELDSVILFAYNLTLFQKTVSPTKKIRAQYEGLSMTYGNVYVLPYDKNGRDMLKVMSSRDWQARVREYIMEEPSQDTHALDFVCDYYDGDTYTFVFCVPNLSRYLDFLHKVIYVNDREKFKIVCFDYQKEFIMQSAGKYARIMEANFTDFMRDWH